MLTRRGSRVARCQSRRRWSSISTACWSSPSRSGTRRAEDLVRERGGTWDERATTDMMGMSSKEWSSYMHDRLGVPMTPAEINDDVVRRVAAAYDEHLPLLPHAVETVRELGGRWRLAVASSSNRPIIELVLDHMGVRECFAAVVSSEEVANGKPAPDVYLAAARELAVDPKDCVGDRGLDERHQVGRRSRHAHDRSAESPVPTGRRRARVGGRGRAVARRGHTRPRHLPLTGPTARRRRAGPRSNQRACAAWRHSRRRRTSRA